MLSKLLDTFNHYKNIILWDADYYELIHGVGLSAVFMIWGMWISYVVTILSARWFGADGMGLMAMINTIIVFAGAIAWLGIQWSVVRYINQRKAQWVAGRIRTLHTYIIKTVLPFSIFIAVVLLLLRGWLANTVFGEPRLEQLILYLAFAFPLIVLWNIGMEMIKGYKDLTTYHSINKIAKVLLRLGIIGLIWGGSQTLLGPAIAMILASASGFFMMLPGLWGWWRELPKDNTVIPAEAGILRTSLPMMVTLLSWLVINQTDIVMLGIMRDTSEVGVYQVALRIAMLIPFWLIIVNMIVWQKIAQLFYSKQKKKLQDLLKMASWISTWIGLIAFIVFFIFAKHRMAIFGKEFIYWAILLQILCFWQFVNACAWPVGNYLNMTGRQKILQYIISITAILNIILNLILIPKFWSEWAAISSAISLVSWNLIMAIYVKKYDWIKTYIWL